MLDEGQGQGTAIGTALILVAPDPLLPYDCCDACYRIGHSYKVWNPEQSLNARLVGRLDKVWILHARDEHDMKRLCRFSFRKSLQEEL